MHAPTSARPLRAARKLPRCRVLQVRLQRPCLRVVAAAADASDQPPAGCARYTVKIKKRLGLVLEKGKQGGIFVVEIAPDGNAAKEGSIRVGDELIATSGWMYTRESDYGGATVRSGEKEVRLLARQEEFDTIMAAIGSHPGNIPVTLELQRCDPQQQ